MSGTNGLWAFLKRSVSALLGLQQSAPIAQPAPQAQSAVEPRPLFVAAMPADAASLTTAPAQQAAITAAPPSSSGYLAGMLAVTAKLNARKGRRKSKRSAARTNRPLRAVAPAAKRSPRQPIWLGAEKRRRAAPVKTSTVIAFRAKPKTQSRQQSARTAAQLKRAA